MGTRRVHERTYCRGVVECLWEHGNILIEMESPLHGNVYLMVNEWTSFTISGARHFGCKVLNISGCLTVLTVAAKVNTKELLPTEGSGPHFPLKNNIDFLGPVAGNKRSECGRRQGERRFRPSDRGRLKVSSATGFPRLSAFRSLEPLIRPERN